MICDTVPYPFGDNYQKTVRCVKGKDRISNYIQTDCGPYTILSRYKRAKKISPKPLHHH